MFTLLQQRQLLVVGDLQMPLPDPFVPGQPRHNDDPGGLQVNFKFRYLSIQLNPLKRGFRLTVSLHGSILSYAAAVASYGYHQIAPRFRSQKKCCPSSQMGFGDQQIARRGLLRSAA